MSSSSIAKRANYANKAFSLSYISNMLNPLMEDETANDDQNKTKDETLIDLGDSIKSIDDIINQKNDSFEFNYRVTKNNKTTNRNNGCNNNKGLVDEMDYVSKKIKLTDNEIFNHIYFALFDKSKSEHYTCMYESLATLDNLNKKFKYPNYPHLLEKVYPYLINKSKNGVSRCYFSAIQINVAQFFKSMDKDFDRRLSFSEFYHGIINILYETDKDNHFSNKSSLNLSHNTSFINTNSFDCDDIFKMVDSCQLEIDDKAIFNLFKRFDANEDGFISFNEFVKGFNVPMCQQRINILNKAFDKLG